MKVCITGYGVISAIGKNAKENAERLREGQTGIGKAKFLDSRYAEDHEFGEVPLSDEDLRNGLPIETKGYTRTDLLARWALGEAIEHAALEEDKIRSYRTSLISATTVGGMYEMNALYEDANKIGPPSEYINSYSNGLHTQKMVEEFGIKGPISTINTACSASANAIMLGSRLIRSGRIDRAIVGGVDSLAKFAVNGFNALQVFSDQKCRPFDKDRNGLNLGEGACYLVLESEAVRKNKPSYGEVLGYGNSNDAYHPSSLSEEAIGVKAAMEKALEKAEITPENIDHINAHGTATENNDLVESIGLKKVFGEKIPPYNSTKSYIGHTLAASGAIEAFYCLLSINQNELYPSLQWSAPIPEVGTPPITQYRNEVPVNTVMSNSFGFAGNCTSLIIRNEDRCI